MNSAWLEAWPPFGHYPKPGETGGFNMKHATHLTRPMPCYADVCITFPVTPQGIRSADLKEALGWKPQATDRLGVIILCK